MVYRCILAKWAEEETPGVRKTFEGEFTPEQLTDLNSKGYNIYFFPNSPSVYTPGSNVDGPDIDQFNYVFVDCDLKDGVHKSKDAFVEAIAKGGKEPSFTVDSGNGVHAYWQVSDLDAMSYLRIQRRLARKFNTDLAVGKICQLMRLPGYHNTKQKGNYKLCATLQEGGAPMTCEELDKWLPKLNHEDLEYCQRHYDLTYNIDSEHTKIDDNIPAKFHKLVRENGEVKDIWCGNTDDRSKADYRLGHIMFASEFTKKEALSVLVNSSKALERAPQHRVSYANNIIDKIWTFEMADDKTSLKLSSTVRDILLKSGDSIKGTRFPCWKYIDATEHGFRLGQVIGLVAGSGVGKTSMALNMFMGFVQYNPDYDHFFIPLEQPANEIADRWRTMCDGKEHLHDKVHVISNYDDDGSFRHLSLAEIQDYLVKFQEVTGRKVGCVVIDHIGVLKKKNSRTGENQDLMDICHQMKAFAVKTNTLLVMQSQTSREKAGIGDLELNKDAAYGTQFFEAYCDYLITIWQPLKRVVKEAAHISVTAFKFCKIRHKKQGLDDICEDVCYRLFFDSKNETMRELTQTEEKAFDFLNKKATNLRKADRKTDIVPYQSITWTAGGDNTDGKTNHNQDTNGVEEVI